RLRKPSQRESERRTAGSSSTMYTTGRYMMKIKFAAGLQAFSGKRPHNTAHQLGVRLRPESDGSRALLALACPCSRTAIRNFVKLRSAYGCTHV
ncbi:MAG TPA: hypothetical protein VED85_00710, partial [Burkholderiaceae bacterium]|nr:hypothetical protein [Burkholderiaceae bacterium]